MHGQHFQGPHWYIQEREAIKVGTTAETDVQIQGCTYASTELDPILFGLCFPHPQNASAWHFFILTDFLIVLTLIKRKKKKPTHKPQNHYFLDLLLSRDSFQNIWHFTVVLYSNKG